MSARPLGRRTYFEVAAHMDALDRQPWQKEQEKFKMDLRCLSVKLSTVGSRNEETSKFSSRRVGSPGHETYF